MLISIITVTYNAEKTLPPTIASVAEQTCKDYEHIIVDGASKDSTIEIIRNAAADSEHIIYKSEPDKGIYDAMNKGMMMASGQYYIFLNAGDSFHSPTTLAEIARAIEENDTPGIVYGQTQLVDCDRHRIADRHLRAPEVLTYKSFAKGMVVCHQAFVVLARIAPLYNTDYRYSADYEWCIRCLQHSRRNIYIPDIVIDYLSEGVTTANHKASLRERFRIMSHYYGLIPTLIRHLGFIPRYLRHKKAMQQSDN